ncbi:hypothetical protein T492DRAFT_344364 [Pavlovales sp. CCMP2436]|nr:hypothetical protein T492DRAFT_344364 [Pavlovales sp. CCMP2436]
MRTEPQIPQACPHFGAGIPFPRGSAPRPPPAYVRSLSEAQAYRGNPLVALLLARAHEVEAPIGHLYCAAEAPTGAADAGQEQTGAEWTRRREADGGEGGRGRWGRGLLVKEQRSRPAMSASSVALTAVHRLSSIDCTGWGLETGTGLGAGLVRSTAAGRVARRAAGC